MAPEPVAPEPGPPGPPPPSAVERGQCHINRFYLFVIVSFFFSCCSTHYSDRLQPPPHLTPLTSPSSPPHPSSRALCCHSLGACAEGVGGSRVTAAGGSGGGGRSGGGGGPRFVKLGSGRELSEPPREGRVCYPPTLFTCTPSPLWSSAHTHAQTHSFVQLDLIRGLARHSWPIRTSGRGHLTQGKQFLRSL